MVQAVWLRMFRFKSSRILTGITRPNIHGDVTTLSLPWPVCQRPHQGGGFVASEMSNERRALTFSNNALADIAPAWDAQAISLPMTASIKQGTMHEAGTARQSGG
jgi:hypothetical protein